MGITLAFYRTHSSTDPLYRAMTALDKNAANPAIALRPHSGAQWYGIIDSQRSLEMADGSLWTRP
jgi:hypothetical protein